MARHAINPDDSAFLNFLKNLNEGDTFEDQDGDTIEVESKHNVPTHFRWHQRVFPAGMILHKADSNLRVFIEAEKLGMRIEGTDLENYQDKQISNAGEVLPADRGLDRSEVQE